MLLLFFLFCSQIFSSPIQERLEKAKQGDFLVVEGGKMTTLILIHSNYPETIVLEEISIPTQKVSNLSVSWPVWLQNRAPGHSSWSMIEIEKEKGDILECYSFSRAAWIQISPQESIFSTLLKLPMEKVPFEERRKIGPPPLGDEPDLRKVWEPKAVVEGKKENIHFDVYKATWPKDGTDLAGLDLLLYFDQEMKFPFPFWIQVETPHIHLSLKAIDSGKNIVSPYKTLPRRIPQFVGLPKQEESGLKISLKAPKYYKDFELFAVDVTGQEKEIYPIPQVQMEKEGEKIILSITNEILGEILESEHKYHLLIVPNGHTESYIQTAKPITWNYDVVCKEKLR